MLGNAILPSPVKFRGGQRLSHLPIKTLLAVNTTEKNEIACLSQNDLNDLYSHTQTIDKVENLRLGSRLVYIC